MSESWEEWNEGYLAMVLFVSFTLVAVLTVFLYLKYRNGCPGSPGYRETDAEPENQWIPHPVDIYDDVEAASDPERQTKSPLDTIARSGNFSPGEMDTEGEGTPTDRKPDPRLATVSPFSYPETVVAEEALVRRNLVTERAMQLHKFHKYLIRMKAFYSMKKRGGPASLGLQLKGEDPGSLISPVLVSKVQRGGAAANARVTKADGEELPPEQASLQPGDLLLKVSTDDTRRRYENGERSALYDDDSWAIFKRIHVMVAVGPIGGTYEGSEVTLWVVRDPEFQAKWKKALEEYAVKFETADAGEIPVTETYSFEENPLAVDVDTFYTMFPPIDRDILLKADITMAAQSRKSHRVRQDQLQELASKSGIGVDTKKFYEFQSSHEKAMEFMRECFEEVDVNKDGKLSFEEMRAVHTKLVQIMGLPVLSDDHLQEDFEEADLNSDGVLSFDEYIPYLHEQVLEALFRLDDRRMGAESGLAASGHGSIRRAGTSASNVSSPEHFM